MKRIIEIPDKIVKAIQNGEDYRYDIHTAIAQSIPYNPSGDCISREALRKEVTEKVTHTTVDGHLAKNKAIQLIDNAQAVEYTFEEAFQKTVCENRLYCPARPKGEWINHRNDYGHNIADCSLCGKTMQWHDEDGDGVPRYCWYCGAEMKGGTE